MSQRNVLMVGLTESGKTTFLAALWHLLNENSADTVLKQDGWPPERGYLNTIAHRWLSCAPQERTKALAPDKAFMKLSSADGTSSGEVWFPDLSGEMFQSQWEDRHWNVQYDEILDAASGAIVFIHVEKVIEPVAIDLERELAAMIAATDGDDAESENGDTPVVPWEPQFAPTQTVMVDLLQLLHWRLRRPRFPVAVVLSAWDKVDDGATAPIDWLRARLPLFAQYLESNSAVMPHCVYGVSAQGGDYSSDTEALSEKHNQWERIIVQAPADLTYDLTHVVRWAFGEAPS